jgi:hypothetical protein
METQKKEWQTFQLANPSTLNNTNQQLHRAAQFIAMVGNSLFPNAGDDSHSNMRWSDRLVGLVGRLLPLNIPVRLALIYDGFELRFVDKQYHTFSGLQLEGQNRRVINDWIRQTVTVLGGRAEELRPIRHYKLPHHSTDRGAPFRRTSTLELQELARYRHNAQLILEEMSSQFDNASPVRIWPHHFDTGSLLPVAFDDDGKMTQSVGIGLAVSDDYYNELYFYVNHWSADGRALNYDDLPELPGGGHWHRKGWSGAILKASALTEVEKGSGQYEKAWRFLRAGINDSLRLLGQGQMAI